MTGKTLASGLTTRDLGPETWQDFESFFGRYGGVQGGCWCMYYHRIGGTKGKNREERTERNHLDKRDLVMANRSRAILVYSGDEVVATCQYGTRDELPRIDNGRFYRELAIPAPQTNFWRITCFFVDKLYRKRGVAKLALNAVLDRIAGLGGGIVEAYPVTTFKTMTVWFGTKNMFEEAGFKQVAVLGKSNVVMQKFVGTAQVNA